MRSTGVRRHTIAKYLRPTAILVLLALILSAPASSMAGASRIPAPQPDDLLPKNTVILANARDARFSRDFSVLLKRTRLPWVVLGDPNLPEAVQDKNLVLIGHLDARHTGELMRVILTAEEIATLTSAQDHHVILEKQSPWHADRTVVICSGADLIQTRNAAEEAIRAIIEAAPPTSDWIRTTYEAAIDANLRDVVAGLQYTLDDEELSVDELTMDIEAKPVKRISADQAAEDVERLFYLLSHGYAGYGFYNQQGQIAQAKTDILEALPSRASWSSEAFSALLHEHLSFIVDCHLTIGHHKYGSHADFWYDTRLELLPTDDGFTFDDRGATRTVVSINGAAPDPFLYPSLNQDGEPIYRLGVLSTGTPPPLTLAAKAEAGERTLEISLKRSDFEHFAEDAFREDTLGGIAVVRARSFSDLYGDELSAFAQTGSSRRGDPVLIVDIRGNGGGNERWPISWIQQLTGRRAEAIFVHSELESTTTMMGRANAFRYWIRDDDIPGYRREADQHTRSAQEIEDGTRQPGWTPPTYPRLSLIANDTTVVVVTNDLVASAGEGMVLRSSQAENVVVVGENTMGALTFGNTSVHRLPHSAVTIWMPINVNLFPDQQMREGVGLAPDLWVPAADAVNYAVAALRAGTITTFRPISQAALDRRFIPESSWSKILQLGPKQWLVVAAFLLAGAVFCYINRKKAKMLLGVGVLWLPIGWFWIARSDKLELGVALFATGALYVVWGGAQLVVRRDKARRD